MSDRGGLRDSLNWDRSFVLSREAMGPLNARYVRPLPHLPDTPRTRWEAAMRTRATEYFDSRVGLLLDAIDEAGPVDDTFVFFTTDHGPGLPGVKTHLNDRGLSVALIMRGPGGFTGGKMADGLVSHLDIVPTIFEVLGIEPPPGLEGTSLVPVAAVPGARIRDAIYSEQGYHGRYLPLRSVRTERYCYVRRYGPDRPALEFNADRGEAFEVLREASYERFIMPREQLFDLLIDPQESVNLIDDSMCGEVAEQLRGRLDGHLERTGDPALTDAIPEPPAQPAWATAGRDEKHARVEMWRERREQIQREDAAKYPFLNPAANDEHWIG